MGTTLDMKMTKSQEEALEFAIIKKVRDNAKMGSGFLRRLIINSTSFGKIELIMTTDNNKPGTLGYVHPNHHHLFIGKKGGYTACSENLVRKNNKNGRVSGWKALIYC